MNKPPMCVGLSPAGTINRWRVLDEGAPAGAEIPIIGPVRVPDRDEHHLTSFTFQVPKDSANTVFRVYYKLPGDSNAFVQVDEMPVGEYGLRHIEYDTAMRFKSNEQWKLTLSQDTPTRVAVKVSGQSKLYDSRNTPPVSLLDSIYMLGDEFPRAAFDGSVRPNYGEHVRAAHPGYGASWFNGAMINITAVDYEASLFYPALAGGTFAGFKYIGISFGFADVLRAAFSPTDTMMAILRMVRRLVLAGFTPVVATIPYYAPYSAEISGLNNDLRQYAAQFNIPQGPDLYTWFANHPSDLLAVNPVVLTSQGAIDTGRLWAQAMDSIYS